MEAMAKLKDGLKFNEVASAYSEDKARQGVRNSLWQGTSFCCVESSNALVIDGADPPRPLFRS